jgi:hypothetical protein
LHFDELVQQQIQKFYQCTNDDDDENEDQENDPRFFGGFKKIRKEYLSCMKKKKEAKNMASVFERLRK